ncbi:dephospho-CoA kinase [Cysteiniphilum halobium]|uniref:dephospho-CoA kinase n=1 Tax=Cysteiniphilum halobium TaxID=2219059 RepID=UPI003F862F4A
MFPVALTGGIGSGKTTVANLFNTLYNIDIICADQIAKEVILLPEIIDAITHKFGHHMISSDGIVDRKALRNAISHDSSARSWLNDLMHPIIRQQIESRLAQSQSIYTIVDIPLLIKETLTNYPYLKKIISVCAPLEAKLNRIVIRDNQTKAQALLMVQSQINDDERRTFSDFVIENNADISALTPQILTIHQKILSLV